MAVLVTALHVHDSDWMDHWHHLGELLRSQTYDNEIQPLIHSPGDLAEI